MLDMNTTTTTTTETTPPATVPVWNLVSKTGDHAGDCRTFPVPVTVHQLTQMLGVISVELWRSSNQLGHLLELGADADAVAAFGLDPGIVATTLEQHRTFVAGARHALQLCGEQLDDLRHAVLMALDAADLEEAAHYGAAQ